jgi:hypothetical protein
VVYKSEEESLWRMLRNGLILALIRLVLGNRFKVESSYHPPLMNLQVIVTSYLFPDAKFSLDRLKQLCETVGKDKLVVDVR